MTDIFEPDKRKQIMSSVRSKNSVAEKIVFKYLRTQKIYFKKHYTGVIGKPDIAIPRKKKAVFIDGDYWHGRHPEKVTNDLFWTNKIKRNKDRDILVNTTLNQEGWVYVRIWESDIKRKSTQAESLEKIKTFLLG